MEEYLLLQGDFLARIVLAAICGAIIGYERKSRMKEAGVRTHMIVALGSALFMVISKYGFSDIMGQNGIDVDPSRIASQVVSGIGFLGAGMIFVRKTFVSGLTTAAGVWTTAAVGMTMGAGLYVLALAATVLVLIIQAFFHRDLKWLHLPATEVINVVAGENEDAITSIQDALISHKVEIVNFKAEKIHHDLLAVELFVKLPPKFDVSQLMNLFKGNPYIKSIEFYRP